MTTSSEMHSLSWVHDIVVRSIGRAVGNNRLSRPTEPVVTNTVEGMSRFFSAGSPN